MSNVQASGNVPPAPAAPAYGAPAQDPGRTLGIVGLILAIFFNVVGLIVSIIAWRKSKAAGFNNGLAKGGIIVGAIFTAFAIAGTIAMIVTLSHVSGTCADLGPGVHQVGSTTYTCG